MDHDKSSWDKTLSWLGKYPLNQYKGMFDFDWTSSSHIKHSLDPGAIADWSVWTGDPHLSLPSPIIHLTPSGDRSVTLKSHHIAQCHHTPAPRVSPRVTSLCLMTNVNIVSVKHNVGCCIMPFEWCWDHVVIIRKVFMAAWTDLKLSLKQEVRCFMIHVSVFVLDRVNIPQSVPVIRVTDWSTVNHMT